MLRQRIREAVWKNRLFWRLLLLMLVIAGLISGLNIIRSWSQLLAERSFQAQVLTQSVARLIAGEARDELKIRMLLQRVVFGSTHYAQIVYDGQVQVELRTTEASSLNLDLLPIDSRSYIQQRTLANGLPYLDVVEPLPQMDGYVRLGFALAPAIWAIIHEALFILGVSLGVWLGLGLLLAAGFVWHARHVEHLSSSSPPANPIGSVSILSVNGLLIDDTSKTVRSGGGQILSLPPKLYSLLRLLASTPGRVFSEEEIRRELWPDNPLMTRKDVADSIYLLRRKLKEHKVSSTSIENVRGHGYKLSI